VAFSDDIFFTHFTQRPIKTRDLRGSVVLLKHSQESQPSRLVVLSLLAVADSEDHGTFGLELTPVVFSNQLRPRFAKIGLETSVVCKFDTGPTFIDIDGPSCHPTECRHNQGVNLSSVIFAIFSVWTGPINTNTYQRPIPLFLNRYQRDRGYVLTRTRTNSNFKF